MEKIFDSIDQKHKITVIPLTNDSIHFEINNISIEDIKTFALLLKDCVDYIHKNKHKKIIQTINKNDYGLFRFSNKIQELNDDNIFIETNLDKFIPEILNVLSINIL